MTKITVKWQSKKLDVEASTEMEPLVLKCQLFDLTGVAPDRQKIIIKGSLLKDDNWGGVTLDEGLVCMMLGTTDHDAVPQIEKKSSESTEAMEHDGVVDSKKQLVYPCGLQNLGNTCYLNATLQVFKAIPELANALKDYSDAPSEGANNRANQLTVAVKNLFGDMDKVDNSDGEHYIAPFLLIQTLHSIFPQFATKDEENKFHQQDANECFTETLGLIAEQTKIPVPGSQTSVKAMNLFNIDLESTIKCMEGEEPIEKSNENITQLSCFITEGVKFLITGILRTGEIEKNSAVLNKNAKYEKNSKISRLPTYLTIQMVRFFYKEEKKVSAKILKDVKFPLSLDVFDFCTDSLKEKLRSMRGKIKAFEDKREEENKRAKLDVDAVKPEKTAFSEVKEYECTNFSDDTGSNNSGLYELKAIITHMGRSANSGHYVAWIRIEDKVWAKCDDDAISLVSEEEILKLSGGGDWHSAYVLIYDSKTVPTS